MEQEIKLFINNQIIKIMRKTLNLEVAVEFNNWNGEVESKSFNLHDKQQCLSFIKEFFEDGLWAEHIYPVWDSEHGAFRNLDDEVQNDILDEWLGWDAETGPTAVMFEVDRDLELVNWEGGRLDRALVCNIGFGRIIGDLYHTHHITTQVLKRDKVYVLNLKAKTITELFTWEAKLFITALTGSITTASTIYGFDRNYDNRLLRPSILREPV